MDSGLFVLTIDGQHPKIRGYKRRKYHTKNALGCLLCRQKRVKVLAVPLSLSLEVASMLIKSRSVILLNRFACAVLELVAIADIAYPLPMATSNIEKIAVKQTHRFPHLCHRG
jgi:hypothetical protein